MVRSLHSLRATEASLMAAMSARSPFSCISPLRRRPNALPVTITRPSSQHSQHRSYAVVTKKVKTRSKVKAWTPEHLNDISVVDFHRVDVVGKDEYFLHTPEQYWECFQKFASVATSPTERWTYRLTDEERPSAQLIHETACLLPHMNWIPKALMWSMTLWTGASEMGHIPSTLSLRNHIDMANIPEDHPMVKPIEARFRAQVAKGKDPDALTLEGRFLEKQGKTADAIRMLERALQVDEGRFGWKADCEQCLGRLYVKTGQVEAGRKHLQVAAEYLVPEAEALLATITDDRREAIRHLYRAACMQPKFFANLAEQEMLDTVKRAEQGEKVSDKWAIEWSRLADLSAKY